MRLHLENIAKIKEADVQLDGITVIAGENDTGKSTIGKSLYAIFNSFWHVEQSIQEVRISRIRERVRILLLGEYDTARINFDEFWDCIEKDPEKYLSELHWEEMAGLLERCAEFYPLENKGVGIGQELAVRIIRETKARRMLSTKDILREILQNYMSTEFHGQINCLTSPNEEGVVELVVRGRNIRALFRDNKIEGLSEMFSLDTQAMYLDDPFVMDGLGMFRRYPLRERRSFAHGIHLKKCLLGNETRDEVEAVVEEMVTDQRLQRILEKIRSVCDGEISLGTNSSFYVRPKAVRVRLQNLSAGMKSFLVLERLLQNGCLEEKGVLILDEPEVHLHPAWQVVYAEIIVLLQKEYGMHILLATHSPYFLRAIEVFAEMHGITQQCRYYLATSQDEVAIVRDVTSEPNRIYEKLLRPFEHLEGLGYA